MEIGGVARGNSREGTGAPCCGATVGAGSEPCCFGKLTCTASNWAGAVDCSWLVLLQTKPTPSGDDSPGKVLLKPTQDTSEMGSAKEFKLVDMRDDLQQKNIFFTNSDTIADTEYNKEVNEVKFPQNMAKVNKNPKRRTVHNLEHKSTQVG
jgi:hypothetical protein